GGDAVDELDAGPEPAGVLPASARAAEPLAEDGARRHQPAIAVLEAARDSADLSGRPHTDGDQTPEQSRGNGQPRAFRNIVHLADDLDAESRLAGQLAQDISEGPG